MHNKTTTLELVLGLIILVLSIWFVATVWSAARSIVTTNHEVTDYLHASAEVERCNADGHHCHMELDEDYTYNVYFTE